SAGHPVLRSKKQETRNKNTDATVSTSQELRTKNYEPKTKNQPFPYQLYGSPILIPLLSGLTLYC
ncbi:MAG: hypothetical protein OER83_04200, partial [Flavobacteriaceae bacterium]|nr:hypothetical protein [Flavobacteriaceae bacterium]